MFSYPEGDSRKEVDNQFFIAYHIMYFFFITISFVSLDYACAGVFVCLY